MWTLARKILVHDKIKFAVAGAGVSMSVLLVLLQVGLYLGFMENTSNLIDHSTADIWVTGEGNENFDFAGPVSERYFYRVASMPGVERAERVLLAFGMWKLASGGSQGVEVMGLQRDAQLLAPWNIVGGDARRISEANGIVIDQSEFPKLGVGGLGESHEITGVRSRVVGLTDGIRSFTTSPFVFTNFDTAHAYTGMEPDTVTYVLVRAAPGADVAALAARIGEIPNLDAYTRAAFSARSRDYWSSRTGVGTGFFMTAVMGILVGLVVVGQILYSGTLEHLKEYGTLKAMGASNGAIVRVIVYQALIAAVVGYVVGGIMAFGGREAVKAANLTVVLSTDLLAGTAVLTVGMCTVAAMLAIIKVIRLDPASVFK
ncbi:MAG: FtsX-like permease family protein [Deltaproteobacteria bacterium]|nr:FtsX-like permease family protein [Deltaproteobacteria bacterium]